jgi:hypothetical protein
MKPPTRAMHPTDSGVYPYFSTGDASKLFYKKKKKKKGGNDPRMRTRNHAPSSPPNQPTNQPCPNKTIHKNIYINNQPHPKHDSAHFTPAQVAEMLLACTEAHRGELQHAAKSAAAASARVMAHVAKSRSGDKNKKKKQPSIQPTVKTRDYMIHSRKTRGRWRVFHVSLSRLMLFCF